MTHVFHWIGTPRWALVVLLVTLTISVSLLSYLLLLRTERPLAIYRRTGGVAGLRESLVVYPSGRVVLQSGATGTEETRISGNYMEAVKLLLKELTSIGKSEYGARPGAADFFSYSLVSEGYGVNLSWVDPWASEGRVPFQLEAANLLMSELISVSRGEEFMLRMSDSSNGISMYAETSGLVVSDEMKVKVVLTGEEADYGTLLTVSGDCIAAEVPPQGGMPERGMTEVVIVIRPLCSGRLLRVEISFKDLSVEIPIFAIGRGAVP